MTKHNRPIYMIVGGLHLVPTWQQPVTQTIDFISRRLQPRPQYVLPLHCTGLEARGKILQAMGAACIPAGVGMKVVVEGATEKDDELDQMELKIVD